MKNDEKQRICSQRSKGKHTKIQKKRPAKGCKSNCGRRNLYYFFIHPPSQFQQKKQEQVESAIYNWKFPVGLIRRGRSSRKGFFSRVQTWAGTARPESREWWKLRGKKNWKFHFENDFSLSMLLSLCQVDGRELWQTTQLFHAVAVKCIWISVQAHRWMGE